MRVVILGDFPIRAIPGCEQMPTFEKPAFWLAPLCVGFGERTDLEIHWVLTSKGKILNAPVQWHGQTFHTLHVPGGFRAVRAWDPDWRLIKRKLDELKPDLVHPWGTETPYALAALRSGLPFILSMQGLMTHYVRHVRMSWPNHLLALYERHVFRHTKIATVDTSWGAEIMSEWVPRDRIREIICGIQEHFFHRSWNPVTPPAALFVGTIDERKGIADLVKAFSDRAFAEFQLWIVGNPKGPLGEALQASSTANIQWLGDKSSPDVADLISHASCLVLPTRADTCPTVVKEARVIGLPIITTPHGGQRDFVTDGKNGFLVAPGDVQALKDCLIRLLRDPELARSMGGYLHQEQRDALHPKVMGDKFVKLYNEVLAGTPPKESAGR